MSNGESHYTHGALAGLQGTTDVGVHILGLPFALAKPSSELAFEMSMVARSAYSATYREDFDLDDDSYDSNYFDPGIHNYDFDSDYGYS
ncbi:uncharacterized protein F5891DRAFT_1201135 [Suillus fuscotomentosus]|uniref:Uncharacterized protein n=1 Tax=Suillus fuscotomentosus TaxID=1912939 RepID=A0AAD4DQJ7_9AGAM|nr:uncharacterized protein F5891DRAFT_1201135 [Suillus fuscotomentosus]KAG1886352.1 hypothetical protein F5891DRAFT_1201135 [Suillus fuscotomentosus]